MMDSKKFKCIVCDSLLEVDFSGEYISPCEKCFENFYKEEAESNTRDEEKWNNYMSLYYEEGYDEGYKVGYHDCEIAMEESRELLTDPEHDD